MCHRFGLQFALHSLHFCKKQAIGTGGWCGLEVFQQMTDLRSVMIVGCCTDICVLQFALSLKGYINQNDLGIEVIVPKNQVATFDAPGHSAKDYGHWALKLMANAGIHVVNNEEE